MRNALPISLILIAAAAGWWLLSAADDELPPLEIDGGTEPVRGPDADLLGATGAGDLAVKGRTPTKGSRPIPAPADPRTLPKGVLVVTMLGPDLEPLDAGALRVFVDPVAHAMWRTKLGLYDKEARAWRFAGVPAGPVKVRVEGDHIVGRTVQTVVKRDRDNDFSVPLEVAGAIQYDVIAYDKTRPDPVKLTLYDFQGKPVRAWYQERTSRRLTTPKQLATAEIGPEGVAFGILPGRYRLRVVSSFDEYDEAEVDVVGGKTAKVSLEVRR